MIDPRATDSHRKTRRIIGSTSTPREGCLAFAPVPDQARSNAAQFVTTRLVATIA